MKMFTATELRKQCARHTGLHSCFICGKHPDITQAHHTYPLKNAVHLLLFRDTIKEPPIVWLCPNCHTYYHRLDEGRLHQEPFDGFAVKAAIVHKIGTDYAINMVEKDDP